MPGHQAGSACAPSGQVGSTQRKPSSRSATPSHQRPAGVDAVHEHHRRACAASAVADGGPVNLDGATIPLNHQYEAGTSAE
jgi:hypothetical protein